jgi:TolA-binding protein
MRIVILVILIGCAGAQQNNFNPDNPDSILAEAERLKSREKFLEAYKLYQQYVEMHTKNVDEVIRKMMETAKQLQLWQDKNPPTPIISPVAKKGIDLLRETLEKYPYLPFSEEYALWCGKYFMQKGEYMLAEIEFTMFIKMYPESKYYSDALFNLGECHFRKFKGVEFDLSCLEDARSRFEDYITRFPDGKNVTLARERIKIIDERFAEKEFKIVRFYLAQGKPEAARIYLLSILKNYPRTTFAEKAEKLLKKIEK